MKRLFLTKFYLLLSLSSLFAQTPDWSSSVASIIYSNCSVCHHTGAIAPFPLMSYEDAVLNGFSIQADVNAKKMPPWPADATYSHFAEEKVLTESEISTLNDWVNNGMPSGDLGSAPAPPTFNGNVLMENPDDTIILPVFQIESTTGADVWRSFVVHTGYTETKYLNQIEFIPGDWSTVHHAIYFHDTSDISWQIDQDYPGPGYPTFAPIDKSPYNAQFGAYVPGQGVLKYPSNMGIEIPPGADFVIDIHYPPSSDGKTDSSKMYLKFCTDPNVRPIELIRYLQGKAPCLVNGPLYIEANTVKTFNELSMTINEDKSMVGIAPHSHLICKSWEVQMVTPPADTTNLIYIPKWDFGWQYSYLFTKVMKVPEGSTFIGEGVFDNTSNNPDNPNNPPQDVSQGQSTLDEMMACHMWMMDYEPGDEDIILDSAFYGFPTGTGGGTLIDNLSLQIFPNPSGTLIQFAASLPCHQVSWSLVDPFGKVVKTVQDKNVPKGIYVQQIDVSDLPSGIYLLSIQSGEDADIRKLVVTK